MSNVGGRPPKYESAADMQKSIDAYFLSCEGKIAKDDGGAVQLDRCGRPVVVGAKPPTVTGLALALGFATRKSLWDYQAKNGFGAVVCTAKLRVEEYAERRLYDSNGYAAARFTLVNNFNWRAQPAESVAETKAPGVNVICTDMA